MLNPHVYMLNRMQWHRSVLTFVALVSLLFLTACIEAEQEQVPPAAPKVTVSETLTKTIKYYSIYTGSTKAYHSADVVARVAGRLESVDFVASSNVKKGDVLFHIEKEKYQALYDSDHALLQSAKADLALAKIEVKRMKKAGEKNAVSEFDIDKAIANQDVALATVKSAQAALAESALNLSYTDVISPIDGVVGRELVDAGNEVGKNEATLLTRVNTMQPMFVYFNVPESMMLNFLDIHSREVESQSTVENISMRKIIAHVERGNESGFPHQGLVDYIDNEVDKNTGTVEVRLRLPNEDNKFFPGLFVRIKTPGKEVENAVLVKEAAVGSDLGGKYILVVDKDNIVALRYVELGLPQEDGYVHIISGLEGGETYIVKGILRARPGLPVQAEKEQG